MGNEALAPGRHFRQDPMERAPLPQAMQPGKPLLARMAPWLYYVGYALLAISFMFQYTFFVGDQGIQDTVNLAIRILQGVAVALVAVKFVIQHPSIYGCILSGALLVVAILSHVASVTDWAFWVVVFVVTAEGVDMKKLAAVSFAVTTALLVVELIGSAHGAFTDNVTIRTLSDGTVFARHSFGLHHANTFGACLFGACTAFAMMTFGRNPLPAIAVNIAAIAFNRLWLYSRTAMLMCGLEIALLVVFYFVRNRIARRAIGLVLIALAGVAAFGSLYLMVVYDPANPTHALFDHALSGRIALAHAYFGMKPLSPWGTSYGNVPPIGGLVFLVDDSYCRMVMENGVVPTILFLVGCFGTLVHEVWKGRWSPTLFGLPLMMIYAASELHPMQIAYDFCLVAIGCVLIYGKGSPFCHKEKARPGERSGAPLPPSRHMRG